MLRKFSQVLSRLLALSGGILDIACENIRFSSLFAPRETSPAAKSVEKRMFSQAILDTPPYNVNLNFTVV